MRCIPILVQNEYGFAPVDLEKGFIGDRSNETAKIFWESIRSISNKSGNVSMEGYNSLFRYFLARMRRKSKCYIPRK